MQPGLITIISLAYHTSRRRSVIAPQIDHHDQRGATISAQIGRAAATLTVGLIKASAAVSARTVLVWRHLV